jgi:transposase
MSDHFWLSEEQLARMEPYFPLPHGVPRVDDRKVVSGIIHVIRNGLRWRDAPEIYGPHKTLYNRFIRWSKMGVFDQIFTALVAENGPPERLMIDATHLKAHRTACSLLKGGMFPALSGAQIRASAPSCGFNRSMQHMLGNARRVFRSRASYEVVR